jgi:WD40 repeat protein
VKIVLLAPLLLLMTAINCSKFHNKKIDKTSIASLPMKVPLTILEAHEGPVSLIKWSPDNVHLATLCPQDQFVRIWNIEGTLVQPLGSRAPIHDMAWSPDGTKIAYTHAHNDVWIADLTRVFQAEKEIKKLTDEQLKLVNAIVSSEDITELSAAQNEIFNKLPSEIKWGLEEKLKMNKNKS